MAAYAITNGTDTALSNVNAAGHDVPARSTLDNVTLTDGELATVCSLDGVAVCNEAQSYASRRRLARVLKYAAATEPPA